jgi:hypothetical protein
MGIYGLEEPLVEAQASAQVRGDYWRSWSFPRQDGVADGETMRGR